MSAFIEIRDLAPNLPPIVALRTDGLGAVFVCDEIKGLSTEEVHKLTAGSSISPSDLTPGGAEVAAADRRQLIEIAKEAQERETRNAKIAAAVTIGSLTIAAIGLYLNYARSRAAV